MDRKSDPLISYVKVIMSEYNDLWNKSVPEEVSGKPAEKKKYIMFIDTERDLLEIVRQELPGLVGYDIITSTSCTEALKVFLSNPDSYVLIVINQVMPCMTGLEFAEEILRSRPSMPVILCMGFSKKTIEEKAIKAGIKEFIVKPFGLCELACHINKILTTL
ncbi:MAG: response regulator [Candidatus Eremiobacterota bacterium]